METTSTATTTSIALRYGILFGIAMGIYGLVLKMTGLEQQTVMGLLTFAIMAGGIWLAHRAYKQQNGGFMSYGQGLGIATIMGGVVGIITGVLNYVYVNFIDPEYVNKMLDFTRAKMEADGKMTEEQIETAVSWTAKMMPTGVMSILWAILATAFTAFIISLIVSAITKHNRPQFE